MSLQDLMKVMNETKNPQPPQLVGVERKPKVPSKFTEKQQLFLKQVAKDGSSCLSFFERAYSGVSKVTALKAKCLECTYLDRKSIKECKSETCPIWGVRPYQKSEEDESEE